MSFRFEDTAMIYHLEKTVDGLHSWLIAFRGETVQLYQEQMIAPVIDNYIKRGMEQYVVVRHTRPWGLDEAKEHHLAMRKPLAGFWTQPSDN